MKIFSSFIILFSLAIIQLDAQENSLTTGTYRVYGNCGMCKATIEKAANSVKGVESAIWEMKTDTITLTYDSKKTGADAILKAIADKGYDSDAHKATTKAYNNLPGCCQYDRPKQ